MRAAISDELMNAIDDKIYLDLEIHILNTKLHKAEIDGKKGFAEYLNRVLFSVIAQRREVNMFLRENGVKVHDVIEDPDKEFVSYPLFTKD